MEVRREVQPTVVAAGAKQRRKEGLLVGQNDGCVDPRHCGLRAPVAEFLHGPLFVPAALLLTSGNRRSYLDGGPEVS